MKSRMVLNLILALLVVVLGLLALYEPGKAPPEAPPQLTTLPRSEAQTLRVVQANGTTVELRRIEDDWRLQAPIEAPANAFRVNGMLDLLQARTFNRFAADADALARYGLAEPRARLTINDQLTIAFGETAPLDQRRYVQVDGDIALIADTHFYKLLGDVGAFASPRLLPEGAQVIRLELPDLSVSRDDQGRWQVQPPAPGASADSPAMLTDAWERARAMEVTRLTGEAAGTPLRVELAGVAEPLVFFKDERDGDVVLLRPDLQLVYQLAPATAAELLTLPEPPVSPAVESAEPAGG